MAGSVKIVTVIQARLGSSRLPGKVMLPLLDRPLLTHLVQRVRAARLAGTVVVATTTLIEDDAIVALCRAEGFASFRGHPTDLLDRHFQAGRAYGATAVVKIPSDCPLIDPATIDHVLAHYLARPHEYDYVSNLHPPSYPDGNDVEVISMTALERAWREAKRDFEREHTTPFIWDRPGRFRLLNVTWPAGLDCSVSHRWTIDYRADYSFIKAVYQALYPANTRFGLDDILALLADRPDIAALNAEYVGYNWYWQHLESLATVGPEQTRWPQNTNKRASGVQS